MQNKIHIQLSLEIGEEHFENAVGLLSNAGYNSFLEDNDTLYAYIEKELWSPEIESETSMILHEISGKEILLHASEIHEQNWNAEWEATLEPIEVTDKIAIVQHGKPYENKSNRLLIEINPKMSFGTGYHETTRLMIAAIEQTVQPDDLILDIGTGTGVLAIAARLLGNRCPILAVDNDSWSIENAIENVEVNHCHDIEISLLDAETGLDDVLKEKHFTLILANINRNTIEKILPSLSHFASHSRVLFSGLLIYDKVWLETSLSKIGFNILQSWGEGEWLCAIASTAS